MLNKTFASTPAKMQNAEAIVQRAFTLSSSETVVFNCLCNGPNSVAIGGQLNAIQIGAVH